MKKKDYKKDVLDVIKEYIIKEYKKDVLDVIKEYKRKNKGKIDSIEFVNSDCCFPFIVENVAIPIKIKIKFTQGFIDYGYIEICFEKGLDGEFYMDVDYCYEAKNNNFIQEKEDESNEDKKVTELNKRILTNMKDCVIQGIDVLLAKRDFYERKWNESVYQKKVEK